jgi:hypothetical protein
VPVPLRLLQELLVDRFRCQLDRVVCHRQSSPLLSTVAFLAATGALSMGAAPVQTSGATELAGERWRFATGPVCTGDKSDCGPEGSIPHANDH